MVYARVVSCGKNLETEITCVSASTGKADGMGELKGGMIFDVSLGLCRRMMMAKPREQGGFVILEELGSKVSFEIAPGRNGKVWVNAGSVAEVLMVGRCLKETDEKNLSLREQTRLVRKVLQEAGLG